MNKNILRLAYLLLSALALLVVCMGLIPVYLSHIQGKSRQGEAAWLNDPRILENKQKTVAGNIYDRNGVLIAESVIGDDGETMQRRYPWGECCAHITGYRSSQYGLAGIEAGMSTELLARDGYNSLGDFLAGITGRIREGNSIVLTVDALLQEKAFSLLAGRKGAVVAIEPATGNILAMVSSPSFDPNKIDTDMDDLLKDRHAPLLNRATQGSYAPGSVFKIITLTAALKKNPALVERNFTCPGYYNVDGFKLNCNRAHGELNLRRALALSCNTTFALLGLETGARELVDTAESFGFNTGCDLPIDYYPGTIAKPRLMEKTELAFTAIGQGRVTANPMQIALAVCGIANGGKIMQPRLVERIMGPDGDTVKSIRPEKWLTCADPEVVEIVKNYMVEVVQSGTGTGASIPGVSVAGKTGSAENDGEKAHAWFVGFAPVENPRVAVAVVVENGGSGGAVAVPIAREIMHQVLFG